MKPTFLLLFLGALAGGISTTQAEAKPLWVYKTINNCAGEGDLDSLPRRKLAEHRRALDSLGIPVIVEETNLAKFKEGEEVLSECKPVGHSVSCFLIDDRHWRRAKKEGYQISKGVCGTGERKSRVH